MLSGSMFFWGLVLVEHRWHSRAWFESLTSAIDLFTNNITHDCTVFVPCLSGIGSPKGVQISVSPLLLFVAFKHHLFGPLFEATLGAVMYGIHVSWGLKGTSGISDGNAQGTNG